MYSNGYNENDAKSFGMSKARILLFRSKYYFYFPLPANNLT